MWVVEFLNEDVQEAIYNMPDGILASFLHIFSLMQDKGNLLREPHIKSLGEGLFEARAKGNEGIARAFFTFKKGKVIVIFHAFIKKDQKIPKKELQKARKILKQLKDQ